MFQKGWQPKEYKGVGDEIRQQHMKTKDMSLKGKLGYFWYYYKVHTLVAIVVIAFGSSWIYDVVTAKDHSFYGIMMNSSHLDGDALSSSFEEYAGLDGEKYECYIDTLSTLSYQSQSEYDLATYQKTIALVQSKDLDVMVLDGQVFYNFSFNGMFTDLRYIFTDEELAEYEGRIYYIDYAKVREAEEEDAGNDEILAEYEERNAATPEEMAMEAESHRHPEDMAEPVPVGIFLDDSPFVTKTGAYPQSVPVYGIVITSQRMDTAKSYLDYVWEDNIPFENMIALY